MVQAFMTFTYIAIAVILPLYHSCLQFHFKNGGKTPVGFPSSGDTFERPFMISSGP